MKKDIYDYNGHSIGMNYVAGPLFAVLAVLLAGMLMFQISEAMAVDQLAVRLPVIALMFPVELVLIFGSWSLISGISLLNSGGIELNDEGIFHLSSGELFKWEEIHSFRELNLLKRARFYGKGGEKLFDVHQSLYNYSLFKEHVAKKMVDINTSEELLRDQSQTFSVVGEMILRAVPAVLISAIIFFAGGVKSTQQILIYLGCIILFFAVQIFLNVRDSLWLTIEEDKITLRTWFIGKEYRFNQIKSVRFGERNLNTGKNGRWTVPELRLRFKDGFETALAGKKALDAYLVLKSCVNSKTPEKVDYVADLEEFLVSENSSKENNEIVLEL